MTNRDIGQFFGGLSYSAIAKIHKRFEERFSRDKKMERMVASIEKNLSNVNRLLKKPLHVIARSNFATKQSITY